MDRGRGHDLVRGSGHAVGESPPCLQDSDPKKNRTEGVKHETADSLWTTYPWAAATETAYVAEKAPNRQGRS